MKFSESPIMIFIRSMVLLAVLIALPGMAICWNHLPKDLWKNTDSKPAAKKVEKNVLPPPEVLPEVALPVEQPVALPIQQEPVQQVAFEQPVDKTHDFKSLELRLKALGAKYYRLEKWGNRGELFRFSCFVTPPDRNQYEKYFQAIGANEVTVMESVIAEIEQWQNNKSGGR